MDIDQAMKAAEKNGRFYYLVSTTTAEIRIHADAVSVVDGSLVIIKGRDGDARTAMIVPSGRWEYVVAADVLDGAPVVEHWDEKKPKPRKK